MSFNISKLKNNLIIFNNKLKIINKLSIYDYLDKFSLHLLSESIFDFSNRINFSFDSYLVCMHFSVFYTYHLFYIHFGTFTKNRASFPLHNYHR
jgi:hypothetical protein